MKEYDPKEIELKWQAEWLKSGQYEARGKGGLFTKSKPKWYSLMEFPYPSGDGLHTGHVRGYTAMDIVSRKRRMEGFDVLYPIGWDAFGLPTENYALKTGRKPADITKENTDKFREQFRSLGMSFDWSREINTTDPAYYKWTQWLFLKFLEHGLAYKAKSLINWCPKDKIGLANEEVVDGACERCGTPVEKREKEQWMLAITKYAERLDQDLDDVDYPERVKLSQRNWIGKSEGAEIEFELNNNQKITVFTTRPDTIYGATFLAIAPQVAHKLTGKDFGIITDTDRENKEKVGVDTGLRAKNPANKEEIPVWVVNYVSADYGTGAIMGVPGHDERDFEFATKYNLPIKYVIAPFFLDETESSKPRLGVESKTRHIAVGIVKHWSEDKYLMLDWKNGWTGFITGGAEIGEKMEDALARELKEETGYKNVRFVKHLGGPNISDFYAPHKKINQHAWGYGMYFELEDGEQDNVADEEFEKHSVVWKNREEVVPFLKKGSPMGDSRYSELFWHRLESGNYVWTEEGVLINSDKFSEKHSTGVKKEMAESFGGKWVTKFKLRDWVFSRQRYWGEPIPVIHCAKCGVVPVPEKDLPVLLPEVENYQPTDTGESPLANIESWVNVKCPKCDGAARRETDVMPNWAGSSWYYLAYCISESLSDQTPMSKLTVSPKIQDKFKHWMPVDWYNGGMEHTTLHLLYSRFWNKFLFDIGLVPTPEPYKKRTSHGLILAEGGVKMSKSLGNVINPTTIVERFGADTLRLYEMFMGPFEQAIAWSEDALVGPRRFLERVWKLRSNISHSQIPTSNGTLIHQTIKKVSEDIETLGLNTAISALMIYANELEKQASVSRAEYETLLKLLAPFAPHITEELWHELGNANSVHAESWPLYDPAKLESEEVTYAIQVNGKSRSTMTVLRTLDAVQLEKQAKMLPEITKWIGDKEVKKVIIVPQKVVNIVTT